VRKSEKGNELIARFDGENEGTKRCMNVRPTTTVHIRAVINIFFFHYSFSVRETVIQSELHTA
jgi:hypothetical protein